jgi:hypothetical protein
VPTWTLTSHDVHRAVTRVGLVEPEPGASADPNAAATRMRGVSTSGQAPWRPNHEGPASLLAGEAFRLAVPRIIPT